MYLDTDCVLALIKKSDWLKEPVTKKIKGEKSRCTSVITVVECRLIFLREGTTKEALSIEKEMKRFNIKLIPMDEAVIKKSNDLIRKYEFLGTFDSLHLATAMLQNEKILSSDHIFPSIKGLIVENPRDDLRP
jgi:predicted nucleic acid-binding protein